MFWWLNSTQPLGRFWHEPEPSQATGMTLARCSLGKFVGVVCYCFPLTLDVPTFTARCHHAPNNASAPSSERWNCGREWCPVILPKWRFFLRHLGFFYMPQIYDMGQTAWLPLRRRHAEDFFAWKIRRLRPGVNPRTWVPEASMLTTRPLYPINPSKFRSNLLSTDTLTSGHKLQLQQIRHSKGLVCSNQSVLGHNPGFSRLKFMGWNLGHLASGYWR
jgi:hypothetical protein